MSRSPFERAVAVSPKPGGGGRYRTEIDPAWSGPVAPNGGVLAAIMLRAAQAELGDGAPPPRTIAAHYLEVPAPGPADVSVEVLRRGKRVAVCNVRLWTGDRLGAQATVLCSAARAQELGLARSGPAAPPAKDVPEVSAADLPGAPAMLSRLHLRPVFGPAIFSSPSDAGRSAGGPGVSAAEIGGASEVTTGGWLAVRDDDRPLDAARLCAMCDLWWPPLFGRLRRRAPLPTLQFTVHLRTTGVEGPVEPPVLARFTTATVAEGHLEERGELWSADGRLLAESVQLALLVLG